jgi:hypothetical protein
MKVTMNTRRTMTAQDWLSRIAKGILVLAILATVVKIWTL